MQKGIQILLVEDNPSDIEWVQLQLSIIFGNEMLLDTCDYLNKALAMMDEKQYDVILLDLSLPDTRGLEGLKKILAHSSQSPVIILTGLQDESMGLKAVQIGAQDYLLKGMVSSHGLKRSINYSIERNSLSRELIENIKKVEASEIRQQLFAMLSHEIRTPLNGIIGFTQLLLKDGLTDKQREQMEAIKQSGDVLLVLINDILDFLKIDAGKVNIERTEFKLRDLVFSALKSLEVRMQEKRLSVRNQIDDEIPNVLMGDPVRIYQILLNLLSNAVKFTGDDGEIEIKVDLKSQDKENATIEFIISDTGIGVPSEKLKNIFEPFIQSSEDTTRKYGGTGLGLSIVKQLVTRMDGEITVSSELNKGTVFTVRLSLIKSPNKEIAPLLKKEINSKELEALGKQKILLADDVRLNQLLAKTILDGYGFETDIADTGKMTIELLKENDYDIVLMDLMMPDMDGFEATRYIRTEMEAPKSTIPIIALTADITREDAEKCREAGMDDFVSKPFQEVDLINKIIFIGMQRKMQDNSSY
jgi:signal transduction histidine kinase